jgi:hypothetical protein
VIICDEVEEMLPISKQQFVDRLAGLRKTIRNFRRVDQYRSQDSESVPPQ